MVQGQNQQGSEVLATVTLPLAAPDAGYTIGTHFSQIWSNPPAATPGRDPGIVVNSFGKGKAVWAAAPIETLDEPVGANLLMHLLRSVLPGPYKFEVDTNRAVEMTLFHQGDKRRLLAGLINMQEKVPTIPVGATVRIHMPAELTARRVLQLPDLQPVQFKTSGPYIQFGVAPFKTVFMAIVEYD
jgi:hypothetical protein